MKVKEGFMLREVLDSYLIMGTTKETYLPHCILSLNEAGALLWHALEKEADEDTLVTALLGEYDVDSTTARRDVGVFIQQLKEKELLC